MCRHSVTSLPSIFVLVSFLLVVVINLDTCAVEGLRGFGLQPKPESGPSEIIIHNDRAVASSEKSKGSKSSENTNSAGHQSPSSSQEKEAPTSQNGILNPVASNQTKSVSQLTSDKNSSAISDMRQCKDESCQSITLQTKPKEEEPKEKPSHAVSHSSEFEEKNFPKKPSKDAFIRGIYVLSGLSFIAIVYFSWQSYRLRRKKTHIHRYGVVANREDLEMAPLEMDDDEDDTTTHFDLSNHLQK